ncbi:MAG: hypothetical protein ACO3JL_14385 [Myxococcota bacterium]
MNDTVWSRWVLPAAFCASACLDETTAEPSVSSAAADREPDATGALLCTTDDDCPSDGPTCCDGGCTSVVTDPNHCGACNNPCTVAEHCASDQTCIVSSLESLCSNNVLIGLLDGDPADEAAARQLMEYYRERCGGSSSTRGANDSSLFTELGEPVPGAGMILLATGGSYRQPIVRYLDQEGWSPVFTDTQNNGATARLVRRDNGEVLAQVDTAEPTTDHDVFVTYVMAEPARGSLLWISYGLFADGTRASALWLNEIEPRTRRDMPLRWAVVRWSDTDGEPGPTLTDTFDIVASAS